jgi:hypothetical protein
MIGWTFILPTFIRELKPTGRMQDARAATKPRGKRRVNGYHDASAGSSRQTKGMLLVVAQIGARKKQPTSSDRIVLVPGEMRNSSVTRP